MMTWQWLADRSMAPLALALTWLVQSSALLAIGLLAGRLSRRAGPSVQSTIYRTTLVAVLLGPAASVMLGRAGFEGLAIRLPGHRPEGVAIASASAGRGASFADGSGGSEGAPPVASELRGPDPAGGPDAKVGRTIATRLAAMKMPAPGDGSGEPGLPAWIAAFSPIVLAAWLLGSAILTARLLVGRRRLAWLRGSAIPAGAETAGLGRELAGRMGIEPPPILRTPFLASPCLIGLRRPAILFPEDTDEGLRDALVHELAHLARHDGHWNLLRLATTAALWPQPLLWVLSRRLEATAEEVCDDVVVQLGADRARYADQLLDLARRMIPPMRPAGVGMITGRSRLAGRIVRILDTSRSPSTRSGRRAVAAILILGLTSTGMTGLLGFGGVEAQSFATLPIRSSGTAPPIEPVGPAPDRAPRKVDADIERDPARLQVTQAILAGVRYLRSVQRSDGSWPDGPMQEFKAGTSALATLALLEAGEPADEPHVARALAHLRGFTADDLDTTYSVALQTMVFAAAEPGRDRARLAGNVAWLERAQIRAGDRFDWAGSWTYTSKKSTVGDNSNTFYALLALDAARRAGIAVRSEVWAASRRYWEEAQQDDGGWGYRSGSGARTTGNMTCAGVVALAIVGSAAPPQAHVIGEEPRTADADLRRGLDWLSGGFTVRENRGQGPVWKYSYLAALERAGTLSGRRTFGDHDWYREGTAELIGHQDRAFGAWSGTGIEREPLIATSFALLFLGRGRPPIADTRP